MNNQIVKVASKHQRLLFEKILQTDKNKMGQSKHPNQTPQVIGLPSTNLHGFTSTNNNYPHSNNPKGNHNLHPLQTVDNQNKDNSGNYNNQYNQQYSTNKQKSKRDAMWEMKKSKCFTRGTPSTLSQHFSDKLINQIKTPIYEMNNQSSIQIPHKTPTLATQSIHQQIDVRPSVKNTPDNPAFYPTQQLNDGYGYSKKTPNTNNTPTQPQFNGYYPPQNGRVDNNMKHNLYENSLNPIHYTERKRTPFESAPTFNKGNFSNTFRPDYIPDKTPTPNGYYNGYPQPGKITPISHQVQSQTQRYTPNGFYDNNPKIQQTPPNLQLGYQNNGYNNNYIQQPSQSRLPNYQNKPFTREGSFNPINQTGY